MENVPTTRKKNSRTVYSITLLRIKIDVDKMPHKYNKIYLFGILHPFFKRGKVSNRSPTSFTDGAASFMRPESSHRASAWDLYTASRKAWEKRMMELGRFVIKDSHFQVGQYVRSVPKMSDGADSLLWRRSAARVDFDSVPAHF